MRKVFSTLMLLLAAFAFVAGGATDAEAKRKKKKKVPEASELVTAIGGKGGFAPKIFKDLKKGMSPGEVKDIFGRMGRVSTYGYAKAKIKGHKGVWYLRFRFDKEPDTEKRNKLHSAQIVYKKKLRKRPEFFERMMKLVQAKWGPASNAGQVTRRIITWANASKTQVVQFARFGDQYEVNYKL